MVISYSWFYIPAYSIESDRISIHIWFSLNILSFFSSYLSNISGEAKSSGTTLGNLFSKASFKAEEEGEDGTLLPANVKDIDINASDFWEKVLPGSFAKTPKKMMEMLGYVHR